VVSRPLPPSLPSPLDKPSLFCSLSTWDVVRPCIPRAVQNTKQHPLQCHAAGVFTVVWTNCVYFLHQYFHTIRVCFSLFFFRLHYICICFISNFLSVHTSCVCLILLFLFVFTLPAFVFSTVSFIHTTCVGFLLRTQQLQFHGFVQGLLPFWCSQTSYKKLTRDFQTSFVWSSRFHAETSPPFTTFVNLYVNL
jgi:predicted PurR-regulated permease PerM